MKCFIDRFVFFNCPVNRGKIRGKSAALAVPFEEEKLETAALVTAFFKKSFAYLEMNLLGSVTVPGLRRKGEVAERPEGMAEAYALGERAAV